MNAVQTRQPAWESRDDFVEETERKPNLYAANVTAGIVAVIVIVCALNEIGVFQVERRLVQASLLVSLAMLTAMRIIVGSPVMIVRPSSKYMVMGMVLFLVLTLTVLLNIHAVLAYVLPILLATQYRSQRVSTLAILGSCLCCLVSPVMAYWLGTWSATFLTGYIQTFCRVTVQVTPGNDLSFWKALGQITLYWSLPQMLTLAAFGIILYSITQNGISGVQNKMRVADLGKDLDMQMGSLLTMREKVLYAMSDIIESRDTETGGHVRRTSQVVRLLVEAMRDDPEQDVSEAFCSDVVKAAPMHDLGKIAVPDTILRKPGRLTPEEYEIVKQHPLKSAEIIAQALTGIEDEHLLSTARNIALYHHERMDGTGYPEGLKGEEIPLEARIMAIADVYDALVSRRCYKAPMDFNEAFETIEASMGTQFDPALNRYFIARRREIEGYYRN